MNKHDYYLDMLVNHVDIIDEDGLRWMMKNCIWRPNGSDKKMCDLICVHSDNAIPIEMKGNTRYRDYAMLQILSGRAFIEDELGMDCPYGKFVLYPNGGGKFSYERIEF